jgi:hypothetical protein
MVETHWDDLRGRECQYSGHAWELTGDVAVQDNGDVVGVEARQTDDVRGRTATLYFRNETVPDSLNPGDLGDHFHRLERAGDDQYLVVEDEGRTYRYELRRMEYA